MPTQNPRPRGDGSMKGRLRALERRDEQLGRQRVDIPKPKPAVAPAAPVSAGAFGLTRANCRSVALDTATRPGFTIATAESWTFFDPNSQGTPGTAPGLAAASNGHFNVTASGWYAVSLRGSVGWSGSPPSGFEVHLNPATTAALGDTLQLVQGVAAVPGAGGGFHASLPAAYIPTPADDPTNFAGVGVLGFEVWIPSSASISWVEAWIDVVRLG